MRRPLVITMVAVVGFCSLLFTASAGAHVLETEGTIGAVLHIDPDDDPIAGEKSGIYFEIKDKTNRFKAQDCNCRLIIERAGQTIYDQPFTRSEGGEFTFPARDVYTVKAVGVPKSSGAFDSFQLSYDIRVQRGVNQSDAAAGNPAQTKKIAILAAVIVAVILILTVLRYKIIKKAK